MATVDHFVGHAEWFDEHYRTSRGRTRLALVMERLEEILPDPPARILDAGGGTGAYAVPLAPWAWIAGDGTSRASWLLTAAVVGMGTAAYLLVPRRTPDAEAYDN